MLAIAVGEVTGDAAVVAAGEAPGDDCVVVVVVVVVDEFDLPPEHATRATAAVAAMSMTGTDFCIPLRSFHMNRMLRYYSLGLRAPPKPTKASGHTGGPNRTPSRSACAMSACSARSVPGSGLAMMRVCPPRPKCTAWSSMNCTYEGCK